VTLKTATEDGRLEVLRRVLGDPPQVHPGAPNGVWRTHDDCYEFMAEQVEPGSRTLEVGLGVSTAVLAAWGALHTCVTVAGSEVEALRDYLRRRGLSGQVEFLIGPSDYVLPRLWEEHTWQTRGLSLLFIDGCHAFPFPALDWYYGARFLRPGGLLVFDDMQIPAVAHTIGWFLELDPRWEEVRRNGRWAAYRRLSSSPSLAEEWTEQLFLGDPR